MKSWREHMLVRMQGLPRPFIVSRVRAARGPGYHISPDCRAGVSCLVTSTCRGWGTANSKPYTNKMPYSDTTSPVAPTPHTRHSSTEREVLQLAHFPPSTGYARERQ